MGDFKTCGVALDTEFVCRPNCEEAACVDLDGEWSEQSKVFRHPDFDEPDIQLVSGEVGEGGDHVNINLKNLGDKEITIPGDKLVAFIDENPEAKDPSAGTDKPDSKTESQNDSESVSGGGDGTTEPEENVQNSEKDQEASSEEQSDEQPPDSMETNDTNTEDKVEEPAAVNDKEDQELSEDQTELNGDQTEVKAAPEAQIESEKASENQNGAVDASETTQADGKDSSEDQNESQEASEEQTESASKSLDQDEPVKESPVENNKESNDENDQEDSMEVDTEEGAADKNNDDDNGMMMIANVESLEEEATSQDSEEKTVEKENTETTVDESSSAMDITENGPVEDDKESDANKDSTEKESNELEKESSEKMDVEEDSQTAELDKSTGANGEDPVDSAEEKTAESKEEKTAESNEEKSTESSGDKPAESIEEKSVETSEEKSTEAAKEKSAEDQADTDEKSADEKDKKSEEDKGEKSARADKSGDKDKDAPSDADKEKKAEDSTEKPEEKKKSPPPLMMRFVNETEADGNETEEEEEEEDQNDADDTEAKDGEDNAKLNTEIEVKEEDKKDESDEKSDNKKPKLKLASFASSLQKTSPVKTKREKGGCTHCGGVVISLKTAVVWEAMQFCAIDCLSTYQTSLSRCSSCNVSVIGQHVGKYCVRFGSDIKQFCSNRCLEDYKKGLKVCSYCQKDISGGEGFLAPIGNKGQFKDFCDQYCLKKYEVLNKLKEPEVEEGECPVCKEKKVIAVHLLKDTETIKFCENSSCLGVFKFANKLETQACKVANCKNNFDEKKHHFPIYTGGKVNWYCSQSCQNVAIMLNRKIVTCSFCQVKKYNFDMIECYEDSSSENPNIYCSLHCRTQLKQAELQNKTGQSGGSVPVISDIFSHAPFAGPTGPTSSAPGMAASAPMPVLPQQPVPPSQLVAKTASGLPQPPPLQHMGQPMPPAVASLAAGTLHPANLVGPPPAPVLPPQPPPPPQIQIQTQTVTEVVKEIQVLPPEVPEVKNKGLQTKPYMATKSVSCKPVGVSKGTQTEGLANPTIIPIPVPIHVPTPCAMYNTPFPVPVPIPLPFPVPVFIPTTRNSMKGIMKQIKKIQNKIPADPFEAELLALAGNIAEEDKDSSESDYDGDGYDDDDNGGRRQPVQQEPIPDLENEMSAERIIPKPLPISTPEPPPPRQFNFGGYQNNKRGRDDESGDETWRPQNLFDNTRPPTRDRQPQRRQRGRSSGQQIKRQRTDSVAPAATPAIPTQPKERPDANHHLKFTYGVNAWKHWVVGKNAELEKQRAQGRYQKSFETDILKLRADELNFTLCMFVKEVKKPNGDSYAADSILYLVLGIQEYLFENGRIDNIFTDVYYDPFTTALHEVVKDFKLPVNELGYFVTRIEEEHLWESKQLGAHSPQVLLNTLVYFNTKYFQLKTPDEHLKLSFSHIMKHWKKTNIAKSGEQNRTVLLRYYPPPLKGQKNEDRKMYEQHESTENPLRCPVKLYEFYLSKCPESTKNRNDMFYLQPERSCVPDSPVWYSQALLNKFSMEKMLARLLMVREVQEHMLADQ